MVIGEDGVPSVHESRGGSSVQHEILGFTSTPCHLHTLTRTHYGRPAMSGGDQDALQRPDRRGYYLGLMQVS